MSIEATQSHMILQTYPASRESKIKLILMLVSDFMVNSMLKSTQRQFYGIHGMS